MIQSKPPAVLYINKLSVLLVSILLLFLWLKLDTHQPQQSSQPTHTQNNIANDSKYLKKSPINPFMRSESESPSEDILPTVTALQSTAPAFSSLRLKLHGIVYMPNQESYAMVSMQGAIQEIFRVNGQISEGLFVTSIAKKHIEVDYFGERYTLLIEKNQIVKNESTLAGEIVTPKTFEQQLEFLEVDKHRNPIRLFMIRRPYAVYRNGEFQGYKIMPGSNEDQFKRLGFKSGDIITYLNGEEFTGPGMKEFVIEQLTHATHIDLIVLRDEQELSITYGF